VRVSTLSMREKRCGGSGTASTGNELTILFETSSPSSTAHSVKDKLQKRKEMYEDWLRARKDLGLKGNGDTTFIADAEEAVKVSFRFLESRCEPQLNRSQPLYTGLSTSRDRFVSSSTRWKCSLVRSTSSSPSLARRD